MIQEIDGKTVYVVEFDEMPKLPITGDTVEEMLYAKAMTQAILDGVISKPGKYGIAVNLTTMNYNVYIIKENDERE